MWPRGALPFGLAVICGLLLALTSNVHGGVLAGKSAGEHSHSAQESFQKNFLSSFLSQSDNEGKPSSKPEETEPHSGDRSSGDKESVKPRHASKSYRRRDRYDYHDHDDHYYDHHGDRYHDPYEENHYDPYEEDHHYDPYEEHHYGHGGYEEKHEDDPFHKASVDCRFTPFVNATTEDQCSEVAVEEFDKYCKDVVVILDNRVGPLAQEHCHLKGSCFWDWQKAKKGRYACFCPTPKYDCQKKKQCYWFKYKKEKEVQKKKVHHNDKYDHHGYDDYEDYYDEPWGRSYKRSSYKKKDRRHKHKKPEKKEETHGVCMHNSERFYNLMARLLKSRGKKDFALKIKYSAAPARGKLPYGPHGPAIIGFGEELGEHLDEIYPDDKYNYQFDEEFDPLLWLGYNHPKHGKHQEHGHKKHGHHGYGGGPYGGHGYGGHGYGGHGYGGYYGVGPYDYVHHGHFGKHDYGYGKHHGHKGYGHDKYDHDGGYDDHHEDDYGYDDHHEDDYGYEDRHGYGHKGYDDDYYGYEDPYGPWGRYGRHRRYGHHYGPFNRFGGGHFPFWGQHHLFNPLGFHGHLVNAAQNPVDANQGPLVNTVQNPVPTNQGPGYATVPQPPMQVEPGYGAAPRHPMPFGQPLPTPYPPIYQPIQPALAQPVPQPIETYAPEVVPVPVEEVATKPLDPFFDALTYTDPPSPYGGEIPSYPSAQPPVVYGPAAGLNSEPIPTPTYGPEVTPVPVEAAPAAPLDPALYARQLQDQESSPVPQSGPAMDYFDPMVEFLPEFRRFH